MDKVRWQVLAAKLSSYTEAEIERMLDDEVTTHKRAVIARRLHQRLCKLRGLRERKVIMERVSR